MTITPEKLREMAMRHPRLDGIGSITAMRAMSEALRQAADEIERLRNATPDWISQEQHQAMAEQARGLKL